MGSNSGLPVTTTVQRRRSRRPAFLLLLTSITCLTLYSYLFYLPLPSTRRSVTHVPYNAQDILSKCAGLNTKPSIPLHFNERSESDRYVPGTPPVLIHNATIWTGGADGKEVLRGDVLMAGGLIKWVGGSRVSKMEGLVIVDAKGKWVTPGIVDLHSHLGVDSAPALSGASDTNSILGIAQPWLRSLDGLNTHDDAYALSISGGVTSANVLPGSANAIGGQAFPIKLRPTAERSSSSKLIEQIGSPNATGWRQMKHACGENPSRVYSGTRMDTIWAFRQAYNEARKLVSAQDAFCSKAEAGLWDDLRAESVSLNVPEDLKWEALADVIRGKVKVHNHCYEAVDFDGIVRLTNEFKFPIAAFHHAHEAYLVPDLIKKAWGETPAVAIFATNARFKKEAYRGSEFAARILADNDLRVVMKSDHPVLNSRHLLWEAQQAFYYGLPAHIALASVTTTPAAVMGLGHRIGFIKPGHDADLVIWDTHPLSLSATPVQVYIDGIPQISSPYVSPNKPQSFQEVPKVPNWDDETKETIKWEGLPPLQVDEFEDSVKFAGGLPYIRNKTAKSILFKNVKSVWKRDGPEMKLFEFSNPNATVLVVDGKIVCFDSCSERNLVPDTYQTVDLKSGSLAPGLTSVGSSLGIVEIAQERSTRDGFVFDPLAGDGFRALLAGVVKAVDGLVFGTRDALLAYRAGVTSAVTPPDGRGSFRGLGVWFGTGRANALEKGAILRPTTGFHYVISHSGPASVSTQIETLRRILLHASQRFPFDAESKKAEVDIEMQKIANNILEGTIPLIIHTSNADVIASLIQLKRTIESEYDTTIRMTIIGGEEAHLLAKELAEADIGVILVPVRPFPGSWESRRILPGPPTTSEGSVGKLLRHGVTVGLGVVEAWEARNARFDAAWAALEMSSLKESEVLSLVSINVRKLLGAEQDDEDEDEDDLVAYRGGNMLDMEAKVVGVVSSIRGEVEIWG